MTRLSDALDRAHLNAPAVSATERGSCDPPAEWRFDDVPPLEIPDEAGAAATTNDPEQWTFGDGVAGKLVLAYQADRLLVEQYRRLGATLHHARTKREIRTVMISSAVAAEGKSLTASNLALTLSQSYQKLVLLIDADLRRPTLHTLFNVTNAAGLTNGLADNPLTPLPVSQVHTDLWLLPAGPQNPNPMSLLTSDRMTRLLAEAASHFDWVIIDTSPAALMPDANLLAAMIDAAIIVVNAGVTPYPAVQKAVDAIGVSRILGVVLNRGERADAADDYEYYGYYPEPRTQP